MRRVIHCRPSHRHSERRQARRLWAGVRAVGTEALLIDQGATLFKLSKFKNRHVLRTGGVDSVLPIR